MESSLLRRRFGLLLIIFVLSGFAGLIYQSIWSHYLGLFLGHAAYAQALVLALFMGGMAIGAALVAQFGTRWRNLVRGYAVVELIIGLFGLVFHWVFVGMLGLSYDAVMPALGAPWLVNTWKWLLAGALILPQTILLGMTFPLMSGGLIRRYPNQDGNALGGLYFTNSIGAAVGVLVAAFVLMPAFGLPGAMITAGIINIVVAGLAWWLGSGGETPRPATVTGDAKRSRGSRRLLYLVLGATFLSSAASFAYEIIFVRMLSLAVGSTLHAFELMLGSFIAGIALGALWIRKRADRSEMPLKLVGVLQILMGLTALLALALYANAFTWVGFMMDSLSRTDGGYSLFNLGTAAIAILIMMPTAFFAGTTLPLFTVALLRDGQGEPSIGRVYAFNTIGAIVGVFAAIHFLIPVFGIKLAMIVAAIVDMAIGVFLLRRVVARRRDFVNVGAGVAVMMAGTWLVVNLVPFDSLRLSSGVYRTGQVQLDEQTDMLFYRDGKTASISVVYLPNGTIVIATNGKPDASLQNIPSQPPTSDEPTMIIAGALPLAYLSEARTAAVIGFGSGMTTHTLLAEPGLERVDTIEIEREMVEGAEWFGERVARAYEDERSQIIIDDAKSYFAGQQHRYDVIVSEPSNPWISGVGALFSKEFYRFVPNFLADDGVFVQWLQLYEIDERLVGSVLNAMLPAFADVHGYLSNSGDLLLVASQEPLEQRVDYERLFEGAMADELAHVGISEPDQLGFRRVADRELLWALASLYRSPANSDYFPILSLEAPRTRFRGMTPSQLRSLPYLDLPLIEWMMDRAVPDSSLPLPQYGHYPADDLANDARTIRRVLVDADRDAIDELGSQSRQWVLELSAAGHICAMDGGDHLAGQWLTVRLLQLAELTLPYLDAEALRGVLIDPLWLNCETLPDGVERVLDILSANARRDAVAMERLGRGWLEDRENLPPSVREFDAYAFASLQLGLIGQGRKEEAGAVESEYGSLVRARGDYGFARSVIRAWLER
ncbi:fused MFS/spermidine synthase [Wenzhouxiangella sp. AB-CW3]|uniref:fused MFS/spermidine synthase n=1 Tax=Wenzhouxiangella sp. AB-CW3 TaxID=2771012 RepID=UPI00168AC368|nr:fused MFS/spermidine synthase [Wenzhouxiangella sp. AB-CW3]QOC23447.1 fused MFS/spermidine synthase [Wenzhouxiangella sp. AB-CW3]